MPRGEADRNRRIPGDAGLDRFVRHQRGNVRPVGLEQLDVGRAQAALRQRLEQQRILLRALAGVGDGLALEVAGRLQGGIRRHEDGGLLEDIDGDELGRQARGGDGCRPHAGGGELQGARGHRLVFRRAVGEFLEDDLDVVLFLDRLEIAERLRDEGRIGVGLHAVIDFLLREGGGGEEGGEGEER